MADRFGSTTFVSGNEDWSAKLRDLGDGPQGPFADARLLGAFMGPAMKVASFEWQTNVTALPDSAGTSAVIADVDNVELACGFEPFAAILFVYPNPAAPGLIITGEVFMKVAGMETLSLSIASVADTVRNQFRDGALKFTHSAAPTIEDSVMRFNKIDTAKSDGSVVSVLSAATSATADGYHRLIVLGK